MYFDLTRLMPDDGEILRQEVRPDRPISVALKCIALKSRVALHRGPSPLEFPIKLSQV